MMVKKVLFALAVGVLSVQPASPQSLLGLQYPFGSPVRGGCGTALSLGGTGTGIGNDYFGLTFNPANLGISGRTTFAATVAGDLLELQDNDRTTRHLDMNLRLLSLTVPLSKFGALGVSVEPYSSANVRFKIDRPLNFDRALADTAELGVIEHGGAVSWQVGWGYTIKKTVRVGIAYRYLNFNRSFAEITGIHGSLNDRKVDSTRTTFTTSGIRGGLQVPLKKATFGISGDYFFGNKARVVHVVRGLRDTTDLSGTAKYHLQPPPSLTAGVSYLFDSRWLAAVDGGATLWDRYHSGIEVAAPLDRAYFVSGGVQFIPAPNLLTPKLYEITQYRIGIRYSQLPSADATELSGTVAVGLPMLSNGGMFDIIFEGARRWDGRFEHYRENIFSFKLGINGARKWYQSTDESY